MNWNNKNKFAFFGTDNFSVIILEKLFEKNLIPTVIVTAPDKPAGRGQITQSPAIKIWAENKNKENQDILILQPEKLNDDFLNTLKKIGEIDFFIVASYGKIIPEKVLEIAKKGTLNVHPSLLPIYRGASPIETTILEDNKETGVTIMLMDAEMDHGPILDQQFLEIKEWPNKIDLEKKMAEIGGEMLCQIIEPWLNKKIIEQEQEHQFATFTKKIKKEDGLISKENLLDRQTFLKIKAFNPWPGAYFFINHLGKEIRVKITDADFIDNKTIIKKVIPEGKKEMSFEDFKRGFKFNF